MSAHPAPADPNTIRRVARAEQFLELIDQMVETGAEIIQDLRPNPQPEPAPTTTPDTAAILRRAQTFDRTTRAVARCMLLAERFEQVIAEPGRIQARRTAARVRVTRDVEDSIVRSKHTPDEKRALFTELYDRLDRPESLADLENRPIKELIDELIRDLGLASHASLQHPRRNLAEFANLHARAAEPEPQPPPAEARPPARHPAPHPAQAKSAYPGGLLQWALQRARDG